MTEKHYFIGLVEDTKTGNVRSMSMLATAPFFDMGPEMGSVAETMLKGFVNDKRPAPNPVDKYHFFNWAFLQNKYGKKKSPIKVRVINVVDETTFQEFNDYIKETHIVA